MAVTCVRAHELSRENPGDATPVELADLFCRQARRRVNDSFRRLFRNDDTVTYEAGQRLMDGSYAWLEHSVVSLASVYGPEDTAPAEDVVPLASTEASAASN